MSLPPLNLVDGALLVSPTQLGQMRRCFQEWGFRNVHRREPNAPAANRDAGRAGHAGLETYVKARMRGLSEHDAIAAMELAVNEAFVGIQIPEQDAWRTPVRYIEALRGYLAHWGPEPFTTLACEVPFAIKLGDIEQPDFDALAENLQFGLIEGDLGYKQSVNHLPVILRGVIDRVVLWDNVVSITDYKFKDNWSDGTQVQYERDPQFKLYALALNELQAAHPELGLPTATKGAMVDAIVLREPFKRNYSAEAQAKMKPRTEYKRCRYFFTTAQLEETRRHALGWIKMALDQHAAGSFVQNEGSCAFHFGQRRCPFLEVCAVPQEQRAMVLASDYFRDKQERDLIVGKAVEQ